jgi:hypothetical protein
MILAREGYIAEEKKGCFGKVQKCSITVVALMREMRTHWTTSLDCDLSPIIATDLPREAAERPLRVFIDTAQQINMVKEATLHFILVGRDDTKIHGLILTNAVSSKEVFARVGYFCTDNLWEMDQQGQTFVETFKKTTVTLI